MLGKLFDKILQEDEELHEKEEKEEEGFNRRPRWLWVVLVFLLALAARLVVLFFFTDPQNAGPGWYGDVYHHWQIAYLSKTIGFKHGFLRLWDFKGLEYYWGLLHPLVLILGFILSGSASILVPRLVSVIFGSLSVTLVFLIVNRHFNKSAAFASALFLALMPVSLFSDTVGMQEPLGLFFLLLGIYLWPVKAWWAGVSWMLSGMVRSEYWLFSAALLFTVIFKSKNPHRKLAAFFGYFVVALLYMKYMLDYTGNPIYPVWTAYLATFLGEWFLEVSLTPAQLMIQLIAKVVTVVALLAAVLVFWKRPRYYLFFILGLANIALIAAMHGFGAYVRGYENKVLVDRLLAFPYGFLGILVAILLLYTLPKFFPKKLKIVGTVWGFLVFAGLLAATQVAWWPINYYYQKAKAPFEGEKRFAQAIAQNYTNQGTILLPPGRAALTYSLVYYEKIPAERLISELYDPFYYYQGEDPFAEWPEFRKEIVAWLKKENAELFVVAGDFSLSENLGNYQKMLKIEEGRLFELAQEGPGFRIYRVKVNET